ncbi:MAG: class I SAM-dependent methyltransferase [Patescibacteria group bacterium]
MKSTSQANLVAETIATYDRTADVYAAGTVDEVRKTRPMAEWFIERLGGKKVIEIGCGPGYDAKHFSEHGLALTAIDLSAGFVAMAAKRAPKARVLKMDMRHLKFPPHGFDGIWAMASFLHVPKLEGEKTLRGFKRVLKPGGLLFISVKIGQGEKVISKKRYGGGVRNHGGIKFFAYYSERGFKQLLKRCGFTILKTAITKNRYEDPFINVFAKKDL